MKLLVQLYKIKLWEKTLKMLKNTRLCTSTLILSKSLISFSLHTKHHEVVNVNQILCQSDSAGFQQSAKSSDLKFDIFFTIQVFYCNFSPNISYNSLFIGLHSWVQHNNDAFWCYQVNPSKQGFRNLEPCKNLSLGKASQN